MDDSQEHMNNSCIRNKSAVAADKSTPEKAKISPLGKSRYGRTRKPKISQDFCDIDDAIDDNSDEQFVKPPKMPKTPNKLRGGHTNINGVHTSLKDIINKPKHRNFHHNNNMEIVHITGDSDVNDMYMYKPKEKVQELPQKFSKMFVEKPKLPVAKNISVTKEKIPDIKDKKLSEQLKPILSEDIFQSPPINVAEVFKIISNKPNEVELETTAKQNSKMVKTYTNKRKSFQRSTTLIESFALPDEPIVPINEDEYIKPMRISEIDVDIVKPESVNLIDRELIDSLWKIGAAENNCCCHDNDISNVPVFDIRSRFTPEKDLYDENKDVIENKDDLKSISIIDSVKNQSKDKILKSNTEENVISTPKLKVEKIENEKKEEKHIIIKRIINKNMDIDNENSFAKIPESPTSIKKEKDMFIGKSPKKGICELIYERDDRVIKKENKASIDIGDIEEHIKISLIDKAKKKEILEEKQKEIYKGGIDINKLKNQINLRMEETMVGTKSDVHNGEEIKKVKDGIVPITDLPIVEEFVKGIPIADGCIVNVPTVEVLIPEVVEDSVVEIPITETVISDVEVPMTKDFEKLDLTTADNKKGTHKPGDLMWAKVGRYPYWPCLIINDPETKEYVMNRYRYHVYHVRFFGDNGRRSWIPIRHLLPYDTDLTTVVKENKNEIVIPHKSTKSYKQWLVGCEEADSLKEKTKKEKFQFFRKIFSKKKHLPKKSQERGVVKLSNRVRMKPEQIKKKTIQKKIIQPTGTDKLRMEILENLADILTTTEFRRTTRSSRRNSMKSHTTVGSKNEMDDIEADDDSKKHDSSSYCSEDELNNRKFFPLTVESQIALYKRNNLFKGVSKDRVCQICDKPDGIVKCKGRCSGYYHVSCASRKENSDLSENHSITDISFDTTQSQPGTPSGENQSEKEVNRDQKINGSIKEVSIKPSEVTSQPEDSGNSNLRNKDDKHAALRTRRKSRTSPVDSDDTQIERIGDKNEFKEEQKPTRRSPRKSRIYDTNIPRRITRSQSQERELVPRQAFENKPRRARSQRNSVSENLEEIDMTSMVCDKIKDEIRSDKKICEISLYDIKGLNDLKDWNKGIESEIFVKNIENCINDADRKKIKRALNPDVTHQKDDAKGEEESKSDDAQIVLKDVKEDTNDQARKKQECNVKIVHIKDRKKTGTSPKLTLNQDSEFGKLPLLDQIDHKMQEVMQKVDKKHLYADSTTDYTSSEESAVDLLSPKGKKLIVNSLSQNISTNKVVLEEETAGNLIETTDKKVQVKTSKQNKNEQQQSEIDFKCADCLEDIDHPCFVCHKYVSRKGSSIRQKCSIFPCGKFYHPDCLKVWPQTQWSVISTTKHKQSNTNLDTFVCPVHVCHTCVSDDPRAAIPRCTSDKVAKCLRCPATYHNSAHCIPAGTEILSFTQIICPRHLMKTQKRALPIINTTWCFICSEGGDLICCETCPTSVHLECLKINLAEDDNFICEDCETGRFPLYDEIVWVKLGNYRWWPGIILFPNEIPEKIKSVKHIRGEFVVKFFGTYDHYWVGRGRVFLFQEGDSGEAPGSSRKKTDAVFKKSIQEATEAHRIKREFKQAIIDEAAIKSKHKPPPYIKIKMNRPVGNVRQFDGNISNTTPCECKPNSQNPCGADSDCLNRLLLTECNPDVCPAGEKCQNQNFEKRTYPPLVPYKTEGRGWGLKSLEKIAKGQFVIEYVGEMIDEQEYQRRIKKMHEQKEENYYFLTIDKDRMLDAGPKGNVARFMNHSCQPNCETQKWTVNGDTRVGLFAVDDIPNNTELTFNYNLECVGKEKKMCKCGAPNCSGFIGVKVKPEEQPKRLKSKLKHRRKKSSPLPEPANKKPCFVCGENGDVFLCNNKICTKSYHPRCVNLDSWPDNKWACPWHNCNICTKRTIRCCVKCLNSYCPVHSDGNIRYDKLLGFICLEHDPNKADLQENKIEKKSQKDLKTSTPPKPTEESDVTSTTSEEQDQIVPERQIAERQMTPKHLSDNEEIVTSTPIKSGHDDKEIATTVEETVAEIVAEVPVLKRKRGRPRKDETIANRKLKKLKFNEMREKDGENEEFNKVARKLRTPKPVNYGGVSGKVNVARKRFHLSLRSTSKRKARV